MLSGHEDDDDARPEVDAPRMSVDLLVKRFSSLTALSDAEVELLRALEMRQRRQVDAAEKIVREGGVVQTPAFLMAGWAAEVAELRGGRRQIVRLLLPGDPIGVGRSPSAPSFQAMVALTPVRTIDVPELEVAWRRDTLTQGLSAGLDLIAHETDWLLRSQIVRTGRQTALERMAHLLLELYHRLSSRGLAARQSFRMPLTQDVLADVLGLSGVHVNRTLQTLRRDKAIEFKNHVVTLRECDALARISEFTPPNVPAAGSPAAA